MFRFTSKEKRSALSLHVTQQFLNSVPAVLISSDASQLPEQAIISLNFRIYTFLNDFLRFNKYTICTLCAKSQYKLFKDYPFFIFEVSNL